jgi:hypothetical protein
MNSTRSAQDLDQNRSNGKSQIANILPGYSAAMSLDSSSLDIYRKRDFSKLEKIPCVQLGSLRPSSFKRGEKRSLPNDSGSGWFNMQPTPMTSQLAADIAVVRNRQYMNPNRFYKSSDLSKNKVKIIQLGTVIEGPTEYYASRLTKTERRATVTDEFMRESFGKGKFVQERFNRMQRENTERAKVNKKFGRRKHVKKH